MNYVIENIHCEILVKFCNIFTGTGKTLCLLCSALAWIEKQKEEHGLFNDADENKNIVREKCVPKLIYASRTHSQIAQGIFKCKYHEIRF